MFEQVCARNRGIGRQHEDAQRGYDADDAEPLVCGRGRRFLLTRQTCIHDKPFGWIGQVSLRAHCPT